MKSDYEVRKTESQLNSQYKYHFCSPHIELLCNRQARLLKLITFLSIMRKYIYNINTVLTTDVYSLCHRVHAHCYVVELSNGIATHETVNSSPPFPSAPDKHYSALCELTVLVLVYL